MSKEKAYEAVKCAVLDSAMKHSGLTMVEVILQAFKDLSVKVHQTDAKSLVAAHRVAKIITETGEVPMYVERTCYRILDIYNTE